MSLFFMITFKFNFSYEFKIRKLNDIFIYSSDRGVKFGRIIMITNGSRPTKLKFSLVKTGQVICYKMGQETTQPNFY